jgi:hypothetical protein
MKGQKTYAKAQALMSQIGLTIKPETYVSFTKKCTIIDPEYGEWQTHPARVWKHKAKHPKRSVVDRSRNSRLSVEYINSELAKRGIELVSPEYKARSTKYIFRDFEYGEWEADFSNVFYNKSNHPDRAQKNRALSCNRRQIIKHWRTGVDLVAVGSYEVFVVSLLNDFKIDYTWQCCFKLNNGTRYYIDMYLPECDMYVEIKGMMRPDWVEKWTIFEEQYPNIKKTVWGYEDMVKSGYKKGRK